MDELRIANIPSAKVYKVSPNGEVIGPHGRVLSGKKHHKSENLRFLDFLNKEHKRQSMSISKIVWLTFFPEDPINEKEIIRLKDRTAEYPFSISNLIKGMKADVAEEVRRIRIDRIKKEKSI